MARTSRLVTWILAGPLVVSTCPAPAWSAPAAASARKTVKPAADKPLNDAKQTAATITVTSTTRGARIFLNDHDVGEVPLRAPLSVQAGETYTVRVQKRGFAPFVDTVMAGGGKNSIVEADLVPTQGILRVACNVLRARVMLDGKPIGLAPFDGDTPPGQHELRVSAVGYEPDTRTVNMEPGSEQLVSVTLQPLAAPLVEAPAEPIYQRWWFWTALGVVVAGGVTAGVLASQGARHVPAGAPDATVQLP